MNALAYSQLVQDFFALGIDAIIFPSLATDSGCNTHKNAIQVQECSCSTHSNGSFLRISFTIYAQCKTNSDLAANAVDDAEDPSLALDSSATILPGEMYHGRLDWIFHDVFLVPAPFMQIFDCHGQPVPIEQAYSHISCTPCAVATDGTEGAELLWQQIEQPVLGDPCYTWHECEVQEQLRSMRYLSSPTSPTATTTTTAGTSGTASSSASAHTASDGDSSSSSHDKLYLLHVLALLGPVVRLPIRSAHYVQAEQVLLAA